MLIYLKVCSIIKVCKIRTNCRRNAKIAFEETSKWHPLVTGGPENLEGRGERLQRGPRQIGSPQPQASMGSLPPAILPTSRPPTSCWAAHQLCCSLSPACPPPQLSGLSDPSWSGTVRPKQRPHPPAGPAAPQSALLSYPLTSIPHGETHSADLLGTSLPYSLLGLHETYQSPQPQLLEGTQKKTSVWHLPRPGQVLQRARANLGLGSPSPSPWQGLCPGRRGQQLPPTNQLTLRTRM